MNQILLLLKTNKFDIVVPVYNASKHIHKLLDELEILFQELSFRVILVDDFSSDNTYQTILALEKDYSFDIDFIRLAKNLGQHSATFVGLQHVQEEFAITIDDDLQHHPQEIKKLIARYEETNADLIYGAYEQKNHSFFRNLASSILKILVKWSNKKLTNITSFKLIKLEVIQAFQHHTQPIVFIDEYLINFSTHTEVVTVKHYSREDGKTSYSNAKLFQFAISIILYHSSIPLQFITKLGILMSATFFGIGCYFIWEKLFHDAQIGFTSIIVSIFFSSGLILFALGIIGEYIRKIWSNQNSLNNIIIRSHHVFKR